MDSKERLYNSYVSSEQSGYQLNRLEADKANLFADSWPYVKHRFKKYLPSNLDTKILDLGCGHGKYIYCLKKLGYVNLTGVDVSAEQVNLAHELGLSEVQLGDLFSFLITSTDSMDVVLLMDVLEHLTLSESLELLDLIYERLPVGGKLILHVPNAEGVFGMRIRYGDLTHEQAFTPTSMRQLLKVVGFSAIQCLEDKPVVHGFFSGIRRLLWDMLLLPTRLLLIAETGKTQFVLSQNMLVVASK